MIHMFDFCRADVDFTNLEHLACTEVRLSFVHFSYHTGQQLQHKAIDVALSGTHLCNTMYDVAFLHYDMALHQK